MYKKNKGFSLIESVLALALLGSSFYMFYRNADNVETQKKANSLNKQTSFYANEWANNLMLKNILFSQNQNNNKYLNTGPEYSNYDRLLFDLLRTQSGYIVEPIEKQPYGTNQFYTASDSMFRQIPCVLVYNNGTFNGNTEMGAILFYVSPTNSNFYKQKNIAFIASNKTPQTTGFYTTDTNYGVNGLVSASGWSPNQKLLNIMKTGAGTCGGQLANNSIYYNLNMITTFNDKQLAINGIKKSSDSSVGSFTNSNLTQNSKYLPGHIFNNNTLKSSLNVQNNIVFAENTLAGSQKVQIEKTTDASNNATLSLEGSNNAVNTGFVTNSVQATSSIMAGTLCTSNEVGKIMTQGAEKSIIDGTQLSRSIVVCSRNQQLCNGGEYCYLPTKERSFTFNAGANGLQDANGNFKCPSYAPFLSSYTQEDSSPNTVILYNVSSSLSQSLYTSQNVNFEMSGFNGYKHRSDWLDKIELWGENGNFTSGKKMYYSRWNKQQNGRPITGLGYCVNQTQLDCYNAGNRLYSPIISKFDFTKTSFSNGFYNNLVGYTQTPIGGPYTGLSKNSSYNCKSTCDSLNSSSFMNLVDSSYWRELKTTDFLESQPLIIKPNNSCVCARFSGTGKEVNPITQEIIPEAYIVGLALLTSSTVSNLKSATCSSMGSYTIN